MKSLNTRPTFHEIYMRLALQMAKRSTCARLKVGCVVANEDGTRVLSVGYNGNYRGGKNGCDSKKQGGCGCLHAEDNAVIKLDYNPQKIRIAYVTHLPCVMCAKRLVNAGISSVYYHSMYRSTDSIKILDDAGIALNRLDWVL